MTFLRAEVDDLAPASFVWRRRVRGTPQPSDQVLVVLRFRTDTGLEFIHWFTLPAERITLTTSEWLETITGSPHAPYHIERGLRSGV